MMDSSFLSQAEIDALLNPGANEEAQPEKEAIEGILTEQEQDIMCEIGNISAGASSTALSEILRQRVMINVPSLSYTTYKQFHKNFEAPYLFVEVNYTSGLEGKNIFILKIEDALVIADLMMGGSGQDVVGELNEMSKSAVSEAMNQMIGFSATSMSQMFNRQIEISPPEIRVVYLDEEADFYEGSNDGIVVISFNLEIGEILRSRIMLLMDQQEAKRETQDLIAGMMSNMGSAPVETAEEEAQEKAPGRVQTPAVEQGTANTYKVEDEQGHIVLADENINRKNLNLILDVPLKLSVLLGRTKKNINDILNLGPGSIVELEKMADEPVDILVNDTLIARGEVVAVNEYFGVRITAIISPESRIRSLVKK